MSRLSEIFSRLSPDSPGKKINRETVYRKFSRIPILETERTVLRRMKVTDTVDMFEYACQPCVTEYLLWNPHRDKDYTMRYLQYVQTKYRVGDFYDWAIEWKLNKKMIGTCGFVSFDYNNNSAEIGYVLNPAYWGKEIAKEVVEQILRYGFEELGLNRIEARYMVGNKQSSRVMEKCKMQYEGIKRGAVLVNGKYRDVGVYSILKHEFFSEF